MSIVTGILSRGAIAFEKITYREWLVGMALSGIAQRAEISREDCEFAARWAVDLADATIARGDKNEEHFTKPVKPDISH